MKLIATLPPSDPYRLELEKILIELEGAIQFRQGISSDLIIAKGSGPWLFPASLKIYPSSYHAVMIELAKEEDGTYTLLLFNTGYGIRDRHLHSDESKKRILPFVIFGIDPSKIDDEFFKILQRGRVNDAPSESTSEDVCKEFYNWLSTFGNTLSSPKFSAIEICKIYIRGTLTKVLSSLELISRNPLLRALLQKYQTDLEASGDHLIQGFYALPSIQKLLEKPVSPILKKAARPYYPQGAVGNCATKCLSTWLHSSMPEDLYNRFKILRQTGLIDQIEEALAEIRTRLSKEDPDPTTLDDRVFAEIHLMPELGIKSLAELNAFLDLTRSEMRI